MKSRLLVGIAVLATVGVTIGGTAVAQRLGRFQEVIQREEQLKAQLPADPNPDHRARRLSLQLRP